MNTNANRRSFPEREPLRSEYAEFLFGEGTNYFAQDYLGAHRIGEGVFVFRVWAPRADNVFLTGDFNSWGDDCPMSRSENTGIWVCTLECPSFTVGSRYKFIIERGRKRVFKADPYAFCSETLVNTASLYACPEFAWTDGGYIAALEKDAPMLLRDEIPHRPMNVYEVHLGSWKRRGTGESDYLSYRELADGLSEYLTAMNYTHIELMPVCEHPFDGSWGYQVCGYFAPTSRFGKPEDFMYFVDKMHSAGIGVIMDWVPAHFPKDEHGLCEFDGEPLYEYAGVDRMENKGWGTRCFDVGRPQVRSFLISNALFWLKRYHIDGMRIDAVASMLYLDYGRDPGEWNPNPDGTNINNDSVAFFKSLNAAVTKYCPGRYMIAEESTAFPNVTKKHGLGFTLKWNMGWMNDTLGYIGTDPYFRAGAHNKMTFSLMYAFSENYMLPISHDEVVHGKKSLIDKCFGSYDDKFSTVRAYFTYMMTHPGKKLLFMGCEFGQFREWDYKESLEWFMLGYEKHARLKDFVADLNGVYRSFPPMYERDCRADGFSWIFADNAADNIFVYERIADNGERALVVLNFSGSDRQEYNIPLLVPGRYKELINSDDTKYGGHGFVNPGVLKTAKNRFGGNDLKIRIPALGAIIFAHIGAKKKTRKEIRHD